MRLIYEKTFLYEAGMLMLYGRHYATRYSAIAALIPADSTVLDLCCGPAVLYRRFLRQKRVQYTGLDLSERFIRELNQRGGHGRVCNVADLRQLPPADYVVMQASLYHFLPDPRPVIERMLQSAGRQVIVAEPVRNLASSTNPFAAAIARRLTSVDNRASCGRFTEHSLDQFFEQFRARLNTTFFIPGGREKVFVLDSAPASSVVQ